MTRSERIAEIRERYQSAGEPPTVEQMDWLLDEFEAIASELSRSDRALEIAAREELEHSERNTWLTVNPKIREAYAAETVARWRAEAEKGAESE